MILVRGLVLLFTIAAAAGRITIITIRRTLPHGWARVLARLTGVAG